MREGSCEASGIRKESKQWTAASLADLESIRGFVRGTATSLGATPPFIEDLILAVDELVTNIIVHGYRRRPGEIEIEVGMNGEDFVVILRDHAPPFDPTRFPPPDLKLPLEQRPVGGLGIYLARQALDHIMYRTMGDGRNELTLVKQGS